MSERAVDVALPLPVQAPFSYRVPGEGPLPERGVRVVVPFGARRIIGMVTGRSASPPESLKDVLEVVDEAPLPPPPLLDLVDWIAQYYLAPPGECCRLVVPPAGIRASRAVARLRDGAEGAAGTVADALREGPLSLSTLAHRLGKDPAGQLARLRKANLVDVAQDLTAQGFRSVRVAVLA